ncbi:MAG: hypothetical protein IKW04_04920 [Clostridia bacterium]|nr:hypothetical protein [Clostridia bacterium]
MKKQWSMLLIIALLCTMLAGCNATSHTGMQQMSAPGVVVTTDEDAINQVIDKGIKAIAAWNYQELVECVTPELVFMIDNPDDSIRNRNQYHVEAGDITEEDLDQIVALEKEFGEKRGNMIQYQKRDITISNNTANVTVVYSFPEMDSSANTLDELHLRDELFLQICGMTESDAKRDLPVAEFSNVFLQVRKALYTMQLEKPVMIEQTIELQMKKLDNRWYVSKIISASDI